MKTSLRFALLLVGWGGLSRSAALAQTCNQTTTFDYTTVADGDRKTGSDQLNSGTSVTYSGYTGTNTGTGVNTFAVGVNNVLGTGKYLVWQRNVVGGDASADVASVVLTFNRPVSNLTLRATDLDKDVTNGSFIDRMTFDAYSSATSTTPLALGTSNFGGPGINNNINRFVGTGSGATATSDPAFKANAVTGIATSTAAATGDVIISFPSPVQRVVITYENIAPAAATATTDRTHTMGFQIITFCDQADVYARFTSGATSALPGSTQTYTVQFGNNGPDNSAVTTRTVTIPAGATVTNTGGGTLSGNTINFGTTAVAAGTSQSFTYSYTLPTAPGVFNAVNTVATTTGANQEGATANDSQTLTTVVTPVTDIRTTLSGPVAATQGNLVTLNVTTSNIGAAATANVVQTVQLVSGLKNVYVSNNGSYDSSNGLVTFLNLPTLAAGQTVANTVSFSAPATSFAPTASVTPNTAATGDSNPANNSATLNGATAPANITITPTTSSTPVANLYTTITPSAQTVNPNGSVTLTVVTGNDGPNPASSVVQTVQLVPGLTAGALAINGASSNGTGTNTLLFGNGISYNTVTGLVTFNTINTLASGEKQTNTIALTMPATVGGQLLATAFVSSTTTTASQITTDPVAGNNVSSTKVTVLPTADLAATITGPASVTIGSPVTYTAFYTNNGPGTAINRTPTLQLPAGLTGVTLSAGTYNATTGLVTFPTVASSLAGESQFFTVSFTPATTGNYTATAYTGSSTPDPVSGNNSAKVTTTVNASADLTVTLSGPATVASGGAVTYVAETTNNGPSTAGTVTTTIQLPTGLATADVSSPDGTYDATTGLVTFTNTNLANGAVASNYVTFKNPRASGTNLSSTAVVSSTTPDPVAGNNTSAAVVTATGSATAAYVLSAALTPATSTVAPGAPVSFTATFTNGSGNDAATLVERIYLAPGTVVTNISGQGNATGSYNQATGILTFNTTAIAKNKNEVFTFTVTAPSTGSLKLFAAISSANPEAAINDNVATATINVTQPAAPNTYDEVTSISGPAAALPGATLTYTVQTLNNGPANSQAVTQTVTLPAGVTATNISGRGTQTGNIITFPITTPQAPGAGAAVVNTFTVTMPASGSLSITANVTAVDESNTGNNSSTVITTQINQAPVAASIINKLQAPEGNTAGALPISQLLAADPDGTVASYTIVTIPDAATQGVLRLNGATVTVNTPVAVGDIAKLTFDPVSSFVGNVFFTYSATDNAGAVSVPTLYTIAVGQDLNSVYTNAPVKGFGIAAYQNGDLISSVLDVNGADYTASAQLQDAGVRSAVLAAGSNPMPAGTTLDAVTGAITVSNRLQLVAGTYTVTITTVDEFGGTTTQPVTFTIGAGPLPVTLVSFTAQAQGQDAKLVWRTSQELHNEHFVVERSLDGTRFEAIGSVKGHGTTATAHTYSFVDAKAGSKAQGTVYYRLRQVDTDGTASLTQVQLVRFAAATEVMVFPNPTSEATTTRLNLSTLAAGTYQVTVTDLAGRTVRTFSQQGGSTEVINLHGLPQGSFLITIKGNGQSFTKRLVKE
ncbi:T9SS type A sorting domain-containing protein [Hymenobacter glacieicola]|uniref:Secretion system C-terminal sorting domain-containing protein n=1 Tax=Hymenobacter glacieicola TaxID=1562124 RepID=A0ABQ1WQR5_9BACT|nr:T9SS type A sorting domain-containing protein [Hymenobacter glacieicola]GGG38626.1 hypothetical protein GCM10011378_13630 [Hymenobacter glacieicola]